MIADRARRRWWLALALIYAAHVGLVLYSLPIKLLLSDEPFGAPDYQTHYQQTSTLTEVLRDHGRTWAYDPDLLAGVPVGLVFDVDNKAHFFFTYTLNALGVPRPIAYKLFTLLSSLLAPLSLLLGAVLLRFRPRAQGFVFALGVAMWHFDSTPRFCWSGGMISFATASHGAFVVLGLFYRLIEERRTRYALLLAAALSPLLLVHVWTFAILVVPLVGFYVSRAATLERADHLRIWGVALFALGANLFWLFPALRYAYLIAPSASVGQATPIYLLSDFLEVIISPAHTGFIDQHTFYRFFGLCGAALTIWAWRRDRDPRFLLGALTCGWLFFLTYFAALVPGLRTTEPYRFAVPMAFSFAFFAGPALARAFSWRRFRALPRSTQPIAIAVLLLLVPRAMNSVLYFMPDILPPQYYNPMMPDEPQGNKPPRLKFDTYSWKLQGQAQGFQLVSGFINKNCRESGRVLAQHWAMGEYLRWATDKPIIGGFPDRRLIHEDAYLFRRALDPRFQPKAFAAYLVRYNIRYIVMTERVFNQQIERRRDLLVPMKMFGWHRIYRVKHRANYVMSGHAAQVKASINRIAVTGAQPAYETQSIVLRFHHLASLRCRPGCRVERHPVPFDRAGFVRVVGAPKLPKNFVVEHTY